MDYLALNILASKPSGLWANILSSFENNFGTFIVSVIILTLIIKLLMTPLDFVNRRTSSKMAMQQARIKPELDAINKKYADKPELKNQKTSELYKREKINPIGSCVVMLINLVLTMTIFITLLNSLNTISAYKIKNQYDDILVAYVNEYVTQEKGEDYLTEQLKNSDESVYATVSVYIDQMNNITDATIKKTTLETANKNAIKVYNETKESFLWISNIYLADSPFYKSVPTYKSFASISKIDLNSEIDTEGKTQTEIDEAKKQYENIYTQIMDPIKTEQKSVNGYFILVILSVATAFLNQYLMTHRKKKNINQMSPQTNKTMLIIMPLIMGAFVMFYTTLFAIYIITGQVISILTTPILNAISDKMEDKQLKKQEQEISNKRIKRL